MYRTDAKANTVARTAWDSHPLPLIQNRDNYNLFGIRGVDFSGKILKFYQLRINHESGL